MVAVATICLLLILAVGTVPGLCFHGRTYPRPANTPKLKIATTSESFPFRLASSLRVRNFALKASASDELAALRAEIQAIKYCLAKKNITISEEAMKMVPIYDGYENVELKAVIKELREEKRQSQAKENKLLDKENKLLEKENILLASKGTTSYLAFLESLLLLTLASC